MINENQVAIDFYDPTQKVVEAIVVGAFFVRPNGKKVGIFIKFLGFLQRNVAIVFKN